MTYLKHVGGLLMAAVLVACGGGGGNPGTTGGGTGTGTGSSTTGGGTAPVTQPTLTVALFDASGTSVDGISLGTGFVARATVKDASGQPVKGKLVTFSLVDTSIAVLTPQTALTNAAGIAEVAIAPASVSSIGAVSVSAAAEVGGSQITGKTDFAVQASSLTLSSLGVGSANLVSGGNTPVQVTALIGGVPSTGVPVNVSFKASCGRINNQDASGGGVSVTTDGSGVASAVYDAVSTNGSLCSGAVTITAASAGTASQTKTLSVAAPTANAVAFATATPSQIFVAGSGAVDQAIVKFKVQSSAGTAMPNVPVKFSIITNPGGVGLSAAGSTAPVSATTNAVGEASVSVFSGSIPGPVKVRAELVSDATVFAESQSLTVASGPPSQKFMSLSVETFNIEGWERDGSTTQLTVRLADRQGNAVEDGTVVNFTAEGGQIARSCSTTRVNNISSCSVTFETQNPRPAGGRASVLAYTEGTKDYVDVNGNNKYDAGDTLVNIGDAYRDDDENGRYDSAFGEFVIPRSGTSACSGSGEPFPSVVNTCDDLLKTTVRQQAVILFSSSNPEIEWGTVSTAGVNFRLRSRTNTLLPLPAGTTFTAKATDANSTDGATCSVVDTFGTPIVNVQPGTNPSADLATSHSVTLKDCRAGDSVTIFVKVPSGLETIFSTRL